MFGIIRLVVIGFLVLSVIYLIVSVYSRSVRRGRLEREWDEEIKEGDREAFIRDGLASYDGSLRRKLILGIYVVPALIVAFLVYAINFM